MGVAQVVIVGRPNVGKSSVFNWLAGKRLAVVDDQEGVTRDRLSFLMSENERFFEIVDTGGMGIQDVDNLTKEIEEQIDYAIDSADVILFVVDSKAGVSSLDEDVSTRLRYVDKPIICVANKCDSPKLEADANDFYRLGRGKIVGVSAKANRHRQKLLDEIISRLPNDRQQKPDREPTMKIAIVGRRNTGKSTFVNTLAEAQRMIVSEIPGTTRDSVDVHFQLDGQSFVAIDTPGLRKTKSVKTNIDFYGTHRAQRTVRRADVSLLFFDASQRLSKVDKQLCKYIAEHYKPCIFVVNKWDLMNKKMPTEKWVTYLRDNFKTMWHVPIAFITAETGKNVKALLNHTQMLFKQCQQRVGTGELNRLVRKALDRHPPPLYKNRRPKIYYATQVAVQPPTIVMVCNMPKAFDATYRRYLLGVFRDQLSFSEVPIKLYLQKRAASDTRDHISDDANDAESAAEEKPTGQTG